MINRLSIAFFFSVLFFLKPLLADNFIFDLDGVLVRTDSIACLKHMELSNLIQAMFLQKQGPLNITKSIKAKFYEILINVDQIHSYSYDSASSAYDQLGMPYPCIMGHWLDGTMTNEEIRLVVLFSIEQHPEWFEFEVEQEIISNLITMIFTPEYFISTRKLHKNGISFIKSQKEKGHKIYILSNWDAESFKLLKEKYPDLFNLVDGVVISGEVNALKPAPIIYQKLLERYDLDPRKTWFIDDQRENITAACNSKINGVICEHTRFRRKPKFHLIEKHIQNYKYQEFKDQQVHEETSI